MNGKAKLASRLIGATQTHTHTPARKPIGRLIACASGKTIPLKSAQCTHLMRLCVRVRQRAHTPDARPLINGLARACARPRASVCDDQAEREIKSQSTAELWMPIVVVVVEILIIALRAPLRQC